MKNSGREIMILECKRCGWKWAPRKKEVIICPKCKSAYWNKDKMRRNNDDI